MISITPLNISYAQEEKFSIDYNLEYAVDEYGVTLITHEAIITNLQNDAIPTTYTFSAKNLKIFDVSAETNGREAKPKIDQKDDDTFISVVIENYAIGEGRQNKVSLSYKTRSIASKSGKIWNIYIPRIQIPDTTTLYNVKLIIPEAFGPKIYLSPTPVIEKKEEEHWAYYFTKETFKSTGIAAAFGEFQPVNYKLKYQLKNNSILPSIKEIALPPDIHEYQNVSYQSIEPKPNRTKIDGDGNVIASYILSPKKSIDIEVTGTARLYGKQINPDFGRDFSGIPQDLIKKYTASKKYWEVNSPYIEEISKEIKNENINVTRNAEKIYNFISNNLTYDFDAVENGLAQRMGAEIALSQEGSWTCMEFTDVFISIARAMGIPSREINGYAFTFDDNDKPISINLDSGDYLHSWAEFYDPFYGWVQVDPTWGTTSGIDYFSKLDTNHFAFVVKGLNSEYPYSAGTYRLSENEKLIEVALSQTSTEEDFIPDLEFKKTFNFNLIELIRGNIRVKVTNSGKVSAYIVDGKTIPVRGVTNIYVKKGTQEIFFKDLNGNKYSSSITE